MTGLPNGSNSRLRRLSCTQGGQGKALKDLEGGLKQAAGLVARISTKQNRIGLHLESLG